MDQNIFQGSKMASKTRDARVVAAVPCTACGWATLSQSGCSRAAAGTGRIAERSLSARTSSDERH
jgi:hypothetical protein